jgi:radical SAM-linked protein
MRMALEFEKSGAAKYISHLDLQRAFSRAIRRSGAPVALSKGFNPHYVVSFASALALGIESECECVEMALDRDYSPEQFLDVMKKALPPGLVAKRAAQLREGAPKLAASVREAEYSVFFESDALDEIKIAACDIMKLDEVVISKDGKDIDIRPMIFALEFEGRLLIMRLAAAPSGSLRPDIVMRELKRRSLDFSFRVVRTKLTAQAAGHNMGMLDAYKV